MDKSAVVAGAVLAGAIHLAGANAEVIKRWSNEVQEAINSRHPMVQFQVCCPTCSRAAGVSCDALPPHRSLLFRLLYPLVPLALISTEPATCLPTSSTCASGTLQAVALMHALRANDRLAVSKLVTQLVRSSVRSPMAQCLLVRYVAQVRMTGWRAQAHSRGESTALRLLGWTARDTGALLSWACWACCYTMALLCAPRSAPPS